MLMRVPPIREALQLLRTKDPERDALRRAARGAVMVPLTAGFAFVVVGGKVVPLYALLGAFWLLVVTEFPGNRQQRAVAYLGMAVNGFILISLGTLVAPVAWLAVALMLALGVAVTLAGLLSATMSAGQRATLLFYVWPVCTPAGPIGERLLGWLIALVMCVPAALFLLPPRHYDELRRRAARVCGALADRIEGNGSATEGEAVTDAMDALRANFMAAGFRPVGLSAGSRALVRLVDFLELVAGLVDDHTGTTLGRVQQSAVDVLRCCARVLDASLVSQCPANRAVLDDVLPRLLALARAAYRDNVALVLGAPDDAAAVVIGRRLLKCRVIATSVGLTGRVVAAAAAADARPAWARALGLRMPPTGFADRLSPETVAGTTVVSAFLGTRSVAAHNGLRMGLGLALAVAVTHLHRVDRGFWVVVGTMLVLSSSALATRTKVVQAVAGTTFGIIVGGVLVAAVGMTPLAQWLLVPITVFASTYLPRFVSFTVAQAVGTLNLLIILSLTIPTGWRIGLLRIEDIAVGAAVGMGVSLLLWPRGATAAVSALIDAARDVQRALPPGGRAACHPPSVRRRRGRRRRPEPRRRGGQPTGRRRCAPIPFGDGQRGRPAEPRGQGGQPGHLGALDGGHDRRHQDAAADWRVPGHPVPAGSPPGIRHRADRGTQRHDKSAHGRGIRPGIARRGDRGGESVDAAQPLVTVAANLAQLELVMAAASEVVAPESKSLVE